MTEQREDLYMAVINQLLECPNGQEPEVLDLEIPEDDQDWFSVINSRLIQVSRISREYCQCDRNGTSKSISGCD
jgi:hypothetical protein